MITDGENEEIRDIQVVFTLYGLNYLCKFTLINNKLVSLET